MLLIIIIFVCLFFNYRFHFPIPRWPAFTALQEEGRKKKWTRVGQLANCCINIKNKQNKNWFSCCGYLKKKQMSRSNGCWEMRRGEAKRRAPFFKTRSRDEYFFLKRIRENKFVNDGNCLLHFEVVSPCKGEWATRRLRDVNGVK